MIKLSKLLKELGFSSLKILKIGIEINNRGFLLIPLRKIIENNLKRYLQQYLK